MLSRKSSLLIARILIVTLPFANVFYPFGLEDGLSRILFVLLFISFLALMNSKHFSVIPYPRNNLSKVFLISMVFSCFSAIFGLIELSLIELLEQQFKFFILIVLMETITKMRLSLADYVLLHFWKVFLAAVVLSLIAYAVYPIEEFIFYDGLAFRFGGFHYELFNFAYSTMIFALSLYYAKSSKLVSILAGVGFLAAARSNMNYAFGMLAALFILARRLLFRRLFFGIMILSIFITPMLIGLLLDQLEILNLFAVRDTSSFTHEGSSIYARLYPYGLGMGYVLDNFPQSLLPLGVGVFPYHPLILADPFSFGGTGSPAGVASMGLIFSIYVFYLLAFKFPKAFLADANKKKKFCFGLLYAATITYISFGAGFFNTFAWAVLVSLGQQGENSD